MSAAAAQRMLITAAWIVIGFGLVTAFSAHPATAGPAIWMLDLVFWPLDGAQNLAAPETRLIAGIAGALLTAWGLVLLGLASAGLRQAPELSLALIGGSILVWFVIDSAASVAAGAPANVAGNLGFLALFLWPVLVLRRADARPNPA